MRSIDNWEAVAPRGKGCRENMWTERGSPEPQPAREGPVKSSAVTSKQFPASQSLPENSGYSSRIPTEDRKPPYPNKEGPPRHTVVLEKETSQQRETLGGYQKEQEGQRWEIPREQFARPNAFEFLAASQRHNKPPRVGDQSTGRNFVGPQDKQESPQGGSQGGLSSTPGGKENCLPQGKEDIIKREGKTMEEVALAERQNSDSTCCVIQ